MGMMDKLSNKAEELKGKSKKKMGQATDNEQMQAEGQGDETMGNAKQAGEDAKDSLG